MADGQITINIITEDGDVKKSIKAIEGLSTGSQKAGASIKSMVASIGLVKIASAAFNVLKNSLDSAISRFDTMQKFPKVMAALGFSAEDSKKSITKLSNGIEGLPTKLDDVVASTQQLTSITGDLDKSTDTVLALNNAFLASGASTEDASRGMQQYNQMLSSGSVDLESWKTLQETMPLALQKTAEAMGFVGKSAQRDLYAALKAGTVTFEDFQDQLIKLGTGTGMLADLAKENSLGIATSFGNLKNAVAKNVANIITKVDEITKKLTGKNIAQNIDSLKGIINSTFESVIKSMDKVIPAIEKITKSGLFQEIVYWFKIINKTGSDNLAALGRMVSVVSDILVSKFSEIANKIRPGVVQLFAIINSISDIVGKVFGLIVPPLLILATKVFNNFADKVAAIFIAVVDVVSQFADKLNQVLGGKIIADIGRFIYSLANNKTVVEGFSSILLGLVTAFTALKVVSSITGIISGVGKAISGMLAIISANPIVILITALVALGSMLVHLYKTNEDFRNKVTEVWQAIYDFIAPIVTSIVEFVTNTWSLFVEWWSENQESIINSVISVWQGIYNFIAPIITAISGFIMENWTILVQWWQENQELILNTVTTVWEAIKLTFEVVLYAISAIVSTVLTNIQAFWEQWGSTITAIVQVAWAYITNTFQLALNNILSVVTFVTGQIRNIFELVMSVIQGIVNVALGIIQGDWSRVLNGIQTIISGFKSFVTSTFENIMSLAKSLVSNGISAIKGFFSSLGDIDLWGAGQAIIDGFLGGLKSKYEDVKSFIGGIADWIKDNKGPIEYDRKLLIPAGKSIMDGLDRGLQNQFKQVQKTIHSITKSMQVGFNPDLNPRFNYPQVSLANIPSIESSLRLGYTGNIGSSTVNNYYNNQSNTKDITNALMAIAKRPIQTIVEINKREVARVISKDVNTEIQRSSDMYRRLSGQRV